MKYSVRILSLLFLAVIIIACGQIEEKKIITKESYQSVKVAGQEWMTSNLTLDVGEGSYCYENDSLQCETMGRLYTWEAALKASNEINGWRLPTKEEWEKLIEACGKDSVGFKKITSSEFGFNPQWAGVRLKSGKFKAGGLNMVNYWSSTVCDTSDVLAYSVAIMSHIKKISPHNYQKSSACSVRLVKEE